MQVGLQAKDFYKSEIVGRGEGEDVLHIQQCAMCAFGFKIVDINTCPPTSSLITNLYTSKESKVCMMTSIMGPVLHVVKQAGVKVKCSRDCWFPIEIHCIVLIVLGGSCLSIVVDYQNG